MPWPTATPESQGMDSEKLAAMLTIIREQDLNINSVTVIRSGHVVLDAYIHPYMPDERHIVHSVTKSFTSALIGIAIAEGYLEGVDQRIADIFPDKMPVDPDPRKEAMTLKDVLMMATGLNCRDSYLYSGRGLRELWASEDWVAHILALPMREDPGSRFEYCNSASFLLSAIVQETTGQTALDYAQENLFGPLAFGAVEWPANPEGITIGWGELRLTPRDMAKFGTLYLRHGEWNGARIVPAEWVADSTRAQIHAGTLGVDYGYQWWIESDEVYAAEGYASQYIFVVPGLDLVAVFTSGLSETLFEMPQALLENLIIPAVLSDDALPDNPDALDDLTTLVDQLANPEPKPVPALPAIAESVSGVTYDLDPNDTGLEAITLTFEAGADEAQMQLDYSNRQYTVPIGLDGVYRTTEVAENMRTSFRARWIKDRFVVNEIGMSGPSDTEYIFSFDGDHIAITWHERVTGSTRMLTGTRR